MKSSSLAAAIAVALAFASCQCGSPGGGGAPAAGGAPSSGPAAQAGGGGTTAPAAGPPRVSGGLIRDAAGRALGLRGLNTGNSSKSAPYLPWQGEAEFDLMRSWGMNAVRLLISWKALEPQPGVHDAAYLDEVARRVRFCADRGIYVLLDMHQDLYAEAVGGNGAPDWAVFGSGSSGGTPPFSGVPWYVNYFKPDVMAAFDAFWSNRIVPASGRGLQDHYAATFAFVADRFRGEPFVLGYDLMNEPFYGSDVLLLVLAAIQHDPALVAAGALAVFAGGGAGGASSILRDEATLGGFLAGLEPPVRTFEEQKLMPFYDRVAGAVRAVDPDHILVIEGTHLKFSGGASFIRAPRDAAGRPFDNIVFGQHYYDPSMADGTLAYDGRRSRAENVFRRSMAEASTEGAAFLLGEWGALKPGVGRAADYVADYHDLFGELFVGGIYWAFERGFAADPLLPAFERPYAAAIAGSPISSAFDAAAGRLRVTFLADPAVAAETEIRLPAALYPTCALTTSDAPGTFSERFDAATGTLYYRTATAGAVTIELTR